MGALCWFVSHECLPAGPSHDTVSPKSESSPSDLPQCSAEAHCPPTRHAHGAPAPSFSAIALLSDEEEKGETKQNNPR